MTTEAQSVIHLRGLRKSYGTVTALGGVDFDVARLRGLELAALDS
ncbi:hypothetical protein ACFPIJ_42390 [Dactylosporangium cerinum]|uniref:ABC transporter ATP-binding protein n=1 Tax=Dactylosporangium cerinum TaxID=1434730 RepID=A0ABV9W9V8_9ACTN